jgi:hypothetical protein
VGEGVYGIVEHKLHTHLAFVLELQHEPGEVQRCFNIPKGAATTITKLR